MRAEKTGWNLDTTQNQGKKKKKAEMTVPSFIKIKKKWWFYYSAQCTYLKQIYFFKVPGSMTSMVLQKDSTFFPLFVQACPSNTVCVFFLFWSLDYKKLQKHMNATEVVNL